MKRFSILSVFVLLTALLCAQQTQKTVLVAYFSATGTTARVARQLAEQHDAFLWEIEPMEPYTAADLDWRNKQSRSSLEMSDPDERPTIRQCTNVMPYAEVWLGFPIWWGVCPRIIDSWLDNNVEMLEGKTIHLFATSGGSPIDGAVDYLRKHYPSLTFADGKLYNE